MTPLKVLLNITKCHCNKLYVIGCCVLILHVSHFCVNEKGSISCHSYEREIRKIESRDQREINRHYIYYELVSLLRWVLI
jgi:hypothetical protein